MARFFLAALGVFVLLTAAWAVLGPSYNEGLAAVASRLLPGGVTVEAAGHNLRFSVQSGSGQEAEWTMHSLSMAFGLILALSVLAAIPGLAFRQRLPWLVAALAVTAASQWAGLGMLTAQLRAIAEGRAAIDSMAGPARLLTYAWLFVPSVLWAPLLFRQLTLRRP